MYLGSHPPPPPHLSGEVATGKNFDICPGGCKKYLFLGGPSFGWGTWVIWHIFRGLESYLSKDNSSSVLKPYNCRFWRFSTSYFQNVRLRRFFISSKTLGHDLQAYSLPKNHSLKVMGIVLSRVQFDLRILRFSRRSKMLGGPAPKKYLGGP